MAESLDPAVQDRLARLAARGRVARPTHAVAADPPPRVGVVRPKHPAEGSRLVVGVLSAAIAMGLVGGLAWGSRQPTTAQPSANPPVVVVLDPPSGSGSTVTPSPPIPLPQLPAPSTNSGGS